GPRRASFLCWSSAEMYTNFSAHMKIADECRESNAFARSPELPNKSAAYQPGGSLRSPGSPRQYVSNLQTLVTFIAGEASEPPALVPVRGLEPPEPSAVHRSRQPPRHRTCQWLTARPMAF